MDIKKLLEKISLDESPVALGGCRNNGKSYECCDYDITIFDDKDENDKVIEFENELITIHHSSLKESKPQSMIHFTNMKILCDDKWELRTFLSNLSEKKDKIFKSLSKTSIIEAAVCLTKTKECLSKSDPFSSAWIKCAGFYIADAIALSNYTIPNPTHMLDDIRKSQKNKINEKFSQVVECIGMERATPSLLERMCKSTIGFSDIVENNGNSKIIEKKHDYLIKNSLIPNCYFFLGYINRNNFMKIKDTLHRKPELIHILKIALDFEHDLTKVEQQANTLEGTSKSLLAILNE